MILWLPTIMQQKLTESQSLKIQTIETDSQVVVLKFAWVRIFWALKKYLGPREIHSVHLDCGVRNMHFIKS